MEKESNTLSTDFPRIVIVNPYPISANCPTGVMMENLFNTFDPQFIIQFYTNHCEIDPRSVFHAEIISLQNQKVKSLKSFIRKLQHKRTGPVAVGSFNASADVRLRKSGSNNGQWKALLTLLLPIGIEKGIIDKINSFKPDVLYTQIHSYHMLKYISALSKKISCPVVVHTLDDWMETTYKRGLVSALPLAIYGRKLKLFFNNGMTHMVICQKMMIHMEEKYGGNFKFVMNCIDYPRFVRGTRGDTVKLIYTGGLMLERYLMINEAARIIAGLNTGAKRFELHVFAPASHIQAYKEMMSHEVILHESVKHEAVFELLAQSNILLHVESFNPNVKKYTRYSLSTKIPEYLASGKPVVYFGPSDVGTAEFLHDNKIGICVNDSRTFAEAIEKLYLDEAFCDKIGEVGYAKGRKIFDTKVMQRDFLSCFTK